MRETLADAAFILGAFAAMAAWPVGAVLVEPLAPGAAGALWLTLYPFAACLALARN